MYGIKNVKILRVACVFIFRRVFINVQSRQSTGRNDPCICGSGKKFKKCCAEQSLLSPKPSLGLFEQSLRVAQNSAQKGDFLTAEQSFRDAIKLQKQSAVALAGLGQCLCQLKRTNEGINFLYRAGQLLLKQSRKTRNCKDLLDLAYQLIYWHAPEEAFALAKAALAIDRQSANANYIAALGLQGLNRLDEAHKFASRAVALAEHESNAIILLATLEAKTGKLPEAKQRLEATVTGMDSASKARALLELGSILDKSGEYDRAFECLTDSGEINLQSTAVKRLNAGAVYRDIGQYKKAFDADFMRSTADRVDADGLASPVFLVGFYRSGTTLAEQVLAAHADITSSDEAYLIPQLLNEVIKITGTSQTLADSIKLLTTENIKQLRKFYWQSAKETLGEKVIHQVLVDKTAMNTLNLELINIVFPESVVIFALRDPRDVCLSCFMQPFSLSPLTMQFLSWQGTARFYALIMDYWLSIRESLSLRWTELKYEDVVNDMENQFRPIFKMIGLEWSDECARFYQHSKNKLIKTPSFSQVTQPIYKTAMQRWRNYENHFDPIFPLIERYIKQFGYDL